MTVHIIFVPSTGEFLVCDCPTIGSNYCAELIREGEHAGQIALTITGQGNEECNDTFYGGMNHETHKWEVEMPEECCCYYTSYCPCYEANLTPKYMAVTFLGVALCPGRSWPGGVNLNRKWILANVGDCTWRVDEGNWMIIMTYNWINERFRIWAEGGTTEAYQFFNDETIYIPMDCERVKEGSTANALYCDPAGYYGVHGVAYWRTACGEDNYVEISGTVTQGGVGVEDVTMGGLPNTPTTNADGFYADFVPIGWSGTVTPAKSGCTFGPAYKEYVNVTTKKEGQDYTATCS